MAQKKKLKRPQDIKAGAVPIRLKGNQIEVCLVSSCSTTDCLVLPKGTVNQGETKKGAARRETFEEAGLRGSLLNEAKKKIETKSQAQHDKSYQVTFYLLKVEKVLKDWPESDIRDRRWYPLHDLPNDKMLCRDLRVIDALRNQAQDVWKDAA